MKRFNQVTLIAVLFMLSTTAMAITRQNLINYASSLKGLNKSKLKTAIFNNMQPKMIHSYGSGYNSTWWSFYYTDRIASNNECINRYSDDKFYFGNSNTSSAIAGMNIEHSMPKSWWGGDQNQAYKDLFNLYPSPSSVNSYKSNYPMCTVIDADSDKSNSYTTIGQSNINGTYQWCFEPCDFYKGDFCRGYMYMVTVYQNLTWSSGQSRGLETMDQNVWPTFKEWAYKLYLLWNEMDPVDEVEIDRNNAIYEEIQYNRNLFVDYPYLAEYIWGDSTDVAFNPETSITTADDDDRYITIVRAPIFSPAGGTYITAQTVSISCGTTGAAIYYTTDGSTPSSSSTPYTGAITISETTTIKAIAIKDGINSSVATATYSIVSGGENREATLVFNTVDGLSDLGITAPSSGSGTNLGSNEYTSNLVSLTATDGGTQTRVWNSNGTYDLRIYKTGSITLNVPEGYTISSIVITGKAVSELSSNIGTYSNGTWTGSSSSVTLSASDTQQINTITVNYVSISGGTVSAPTFSPAGGTYTTAQTVSISCGITGAAIYYTTDGSTPSNNSTPYTGAITISKTTTLKAIAIKNGSSSDVTTATYVINTGEEPSTRYRFKKVTSITSGKRYLIVAENNGTLEVAKPLNPTYTYGYLGKIDATATNNVITFDNDTYAFTFTSKGQGYTIMDSQGRYLYHNGTYSSFNVSTDSSVAGVYTLTPNSDGTFKLKSDNCTIQYSVDHNSYGQYSNPSSSNIYPSLYEEILAGDTNKDGSVNISDVTTLVDYILNKNPNPCDTNACDVNNDGMVNIADVTALVDIILQK